MFWHLKPRPQQLLLGRVARQGQCPLIGDAGSFMITEFGEQLGPRGMQEVIAVQSIGELIDFGKGDRRAAEMTQGDGVVQPDYGRRVVA